MTPAAIRSAKKIYLGEEGIKNQDIIDILKKHGKPIDDWEKYTTKSVTISSGQSRQIHFYRNAKAGIVDYETVDFKVKDTVSLAKGLE